MGIGEGGNLAAKASPDRPDCPEPTLHWWGTLLYVPVL